MKALTIFLLVCYQISAFATHQSPDYLIIGKDTLPLFCNPLEGYFENCERPEIIDKMVSTACYRGYVATFRLRNDSLFLENIGFDRKDRIEFSNSAFACCGA